MASRVITEKNTCSTLWDPIGCSTPGFSVLHCILEFAQTHVHWVDDALQPSHHLLPTSPAALAGGLFSTSTINQRRQWHPTPVLLPGKSHGQSDKTQRLHFQFSLSCIREGNGNPLQCSCLENPRDGEPGGLPSMGSHRVGHDWSNLAAAAAAAGAIAPLTESYICSWECDVLTL